MKKIRIVSGGDALSTKVFDADGKEISGNVTKIEWSIDGDTRVGIATITFFGVDVDVLGKSPESATLADVRKILTDSGISHTAARADRALKKIDDAIGVVADG
jgi:hypothetical protein